MQGTRQSRFQPKAGFARNPKEWNRRQRREQRRAGTLRFLRYLERSGCSNNPGTKDTSVYLFENRQPGSVPICPSTGVCPHLSCLSFRACEESQARFAPIRFRISDFGFLSGFRLRAARYAVTCGCFVIRTSGRIPASERYRQAITTNPRRTAMRPGGFSLNFRLPKPMRRPRMPVQFNQPFQTGGPP